MIPLAAQQLQRLEGCDAKDLFERQEIEWFECWTRLLDFSPDKWRHSLFLSAAFFSLSRSQPLSSSSLAKLESSLEILATVVSPFSVCIIPLHSLPLLSRASKR